MCGSPLDGEDVVQETLADAFFNLSGLKDPARFEPWKKLDERLYQHGRPHLFELMGIRRAAQAADLLRRFSAFTGLSRIDDLLDEVRATSIIRGLLSRLGIP